MGTGVVGISPGGRAVPGQLGRDGTAGSMTEENPIPFLVGVIITSLAVMLGGAFLIFKGIKGLLRA